MPEAIGTVGAAAPRSDTDLASAGGIKFLARLSQIAEARDAHDAARAASEQALADLNLGRAAVEAHRMANENLADTARTLENARRMAAQKVSEAQGRVAALLDEASQQASKTRAEAGKVLADAQARASLLKQAAQQHHDTASTAREEVEALRAEVRKLRGELNVKRAEAEDRASRVQVALEDLQRRHAILTEAIGRAAPPEVGDVAEK